MPFSDGCWRGNSKRCGACLDEPEEITLVELGPGRGLFAQDVLAWSKKMFPAFYSAVRYTLMEGSAGLRSRLAELFAEDIQRRQSADCIDSR